MAVFQNCIEESAANVLTKTLLSLGYDIVRVKTFTRTKSAVVLQIMIERIDEVPISTDDCEKVDAVITPILDVENVMSDQYVLEVSSPGIERPLTRNKDFINSIGRLIKLVTKIPINGRKRFTGRSEGVLEEMLILKLEGDAEITQIPVSCVAEANIVFEEQRLQNNKKSKGKEGNMRGKLWQ